QACLSRCIALASFFFQAEDGIRYPLVTGVQTCALPIFSVASKSAATFAGSAPASAASSATITPRRPAITRNPGPERAAASRSHGSEERRVGKAGRTRRSAGPVWKINAADGRAYLIGHVR